MQFRGRLFQGKLFAGRLFRPERALEQPATVFPGGAGRRQLPARKRRDRDDDVLLFLLR